MLKQAVAHINTVSTAAHALVDDSSGCRFTLVSNRDRLMARAREHRLVHRYDKVTGTGIVSTSARASGNIIVRRWLIIESLSNAIMSPRRRPMGVRRQPLNMAREHQGEGEKRRGIE